LNERPAGSLDAVIAFDVLEHFGRDELIPLVDAVHRVLRPGGRWIIHVPNGESPFFGSIRYGDLTHELAFTRQSEDYVAAEAAAKEAKLGVWQGRFKKPWDHRRDQGRPPDN
jgi:SAM-dependent methyltransferase